MGSNNKDDDEDSKGSKETGSAGGDIMKESSGKSGNDEDMPDLNGEFPPTADEAKNLPKEEELTPEQADRKMADRSNLDQRFYAWDFHVLPGNYPTKILL